MPAAPGVGDQQSDSAGGHPSLHVIGAAGENDGNACAQNQSRRVGIGQEGQQLGQNVARFQVGDDKNIGITRHLGGNALGLGCYHTDGIVHGQRTVELLRQ